MEKNEKIEPKKKLVVPLWEDNNKKQSKITKLKLNFLKDFENSNSAINTGRGNSSSNTSRKDSTTNTARGII